MMKEQSFYVSKKQTIIGLVFAAVAIILFVFIWYVLWARVTIVLHTAQETVSKEFFVTVAEQQIGEDTVAGRVLVLPISFSEKFKATGSQLVEQESGIVGEVIIKNNYSKDQTLIETTRLAFADDPETVVARLRTTVTVLAGEELSVPVYFDRPDEQESVAAGTLIIPGLWGPIQQYIVAEVVEPLKPGARSVTVIQDEDIARARTDLEKQVVARALEQADSQLTGSSVLWPKVIGESDMQYAFSAESGDTVSEFTVTVSGVVPIVMIDETSLYQTLERRIASDAGVGQQGISVDEDTLSYGIESYSSEDATASLRVAVEASAAGVHDSELLDVGQLLGKTTDEVFAYYEQFSSITAVDIHFSPSWLQKIPRIRDKVTIEFTN